MKKTVENAWLFHEFRDSAKDLLPIPEGPHFVKGKELILRNESDDEDQKYDSYKCALTLKPSEVCELYEDNPKDRELPTHELCKRKHADGWVIQGYIQEIYYTWVNRFDARHPKFGRVWGDFDNLVYFDKREGLEDFIRKHRPYMWDYFDI